MNNAISTTNRAGKASAGNNNIDKKNSATDAANIASAIGTIGAISAVGAASAASAAGVADATNAIGVHRAGEISAANNQDANDAGSNNIDTKVCYLWKSETHMLDSYLKGW